MQQLSDYLSVRISSVGDYVRGVWSIAVVQLQGLWSDAGQKALYLITGSQEFFICSSPLPMSTMMNTKIRRSMYCVCPHRAPPAPSIL